MAGACSSLASDKNTDSKHANPQIESISNLYPLSAGREQYVSMMVFIVNRGIIKGKGPFEFEFIILWGLFVVSSKQKPKL